LLYQQLDEGDHEEIGYQQKGNHLCGKA
jgi:hypothetical protein